MGITKSISDDGENVVIQIADKFDFSLHQEFKEAYSDCSKAKKFILDLSETSYMDSSALGMILLLKDYSESLKAEIIVSKPSENAFKILQIAQFHRLLIIEQ